MYSLRQGHAGIANTATKVKGGGGGEGYRAVRKESDSFGTFLYTHTAAVELYQL